MTIMTIDTSRIDNENVAEYLAIADRRITYGLRFALEQLGIPVPPCAYPKAQRRVSPERLMAAADADSGTIRTYRAEKMKTGPFAPGSRSA